MKIRYVLLAYVLGFLTCVGCVYSFGMYTTYRIHQMDIHNAELSKKDAEMLRKFPHHIPRE